MKSRRPCGACRREAVSEGSSSRHRGSVARFPEAPDRIGPPTSAFEPLVAAIFQILTVPGLQLMDRASAVAVDVG